MFIENLLGAARLVLTPEVLTVILASCCFGIFAGAMPGISVTLAMALLLPITFFMDPVPALAAVATVAALAIFAGDLPGALLRIPGTPASAAYADEAWEMTRKGLAEQVLGVILVCSVIGGLFGALVLTFAAPALAEFALRFTYYEYFWLVVVGLTSAAFVCSDQPVKGVVSLGIGLLLATVGFDPIFSHPRFTFGTVELYGGIDFIAALIGMFAVAEICRVFTHGEAARRVVMAPVRGVFRGTGAILWRHRGHVARGPVLGTVIGALPGAGSDIAAWISYSVSRRFSRTPEKYGTGHPEGIVAAASANNASACGTWIPSLVFGIPGDSVTAVVIGIFYLKGLQPGPAVFMGEATLVYSIFVAFIIANLLMLPMGWVAIKLARHVCRVPQIELMAVVLLFCVVGSFAVNNSMTGVIVMLVLGVLAFFMQENGFPVAPVILGLILCPLLEESFMQGMILADGDFTRFVSRPISIALAAFTVLILLGPALRRLIVGRQVTPPVTGVERPPAQD